jgi:hypothetical protein
MFERKKPTYTAEEAKNIVKSWLVVDPLNDIQMPSTYMKIIKDTNLCHFIHTEL